jgi:diadenosine tetraphosphate (Ap4A) HIT family hydrolase
MKAAVLLALALAACAAPQPRLAPNSAWPPDNVFARIQKRELPATVVYEDDRLLVIMDHAPTMPGHVLVLSKAARARDLLDVPPAELARMMAMARRLIAAQRDGLGATGSALLINNGTRQSVQSLHIHVVPQYPGSNIAFDGEPPILPHSELEPVAAKLRSALAAQLRR